MKKEFIGFYNPTQEEIDNAWQKGIFAFDANTLLNLYRYTEETRKNFLYVLETLKSNLFIPYQAAYEYLDNRVGVIEGLDLAYPNFKKSLEDNFNKNVEVIFNGFKKHPSIKIETIAKQYRDLLDKISTELDKQQNKHPDFKTQDYILDKLTELFDNCIGKEITKDELKKIYEEGKQRYAR